MLFGSGLYRRDARHGVASGEKRHSLTLALSLCLRRSDRMGYQEEMVKYIKVLGRS